MSAEKTIYNGWLILSTVLLVALATLGPASAALSQSGGGTPHSVARGTIGGGNYRLTSLVWHASGTARGGSYRLDQVEQSGPFGSCCCTFLPLVMRHD